MNENLVHGASVSEAWARAYLRVAATAKRELIPLVVTIDTTFGVRERDDIRDLLTVTLDKCEETPIETVASTIFPMSLWNPNEPVQALFRRYESIWPKVKKVPANRYGTYFRRFTAFGDEGFNQIEHVLSTWSRGNHRRSALQLAVFDPLRDHSHQPQRGFPCLHQVALVPGSDGLLTITAFYATQTLFEKAYGNYLGLARLGQFFAAELGMRLAGITCIASVGKLAQSKHFSRRRDSFGRQLASLLPGGGP